MSELPHRLALRAEKVGKRFRLQKRGGGVSSRIFGFGDKRREDFWAVRDVSVDVPRGSMLGIIGRNGSGKSTFLRTLSGIYRPSEGRVDVRGRVASLVELGAGFHQHLSGRENVYFNASVHGIPTERIDEVFGEIEALAGIGRFIDSPLETYSSGMRARLGFAVTVFLEPDVLIADEITSVGDVEFSQRCTQHFEEVRFSGATVVLVSHNLNLVQKLSDQVLWLNQGEVKALGDPKSVVGHYRDFMLSGAEEIDDEAEAGLAVVGPEGLAFSYTDGPLTVSLPLVVPRGCDSVEVELSFRHQYGDLPFVTATTVAAADIANNGNAVTCEIDSLPLAPGHYGIRAIARSAGGHELLADESTVLRMRPQPEDHLLSRAPIEATWTNGS